MNRFTTHPASVGESYAEHARHAFGFGWAMLTGAVACFVHACFPWLHTRTGSRMVVRLYDRMVANRQRGTDEMHGDGI